MFYLLAILFMAPSACKSNDDDDDSADDDLNDDDDDDTLEVIDTGANGCAELGIDEPGEPLSFNTLVCNGNEMRSHTSSSGPFAELGAKAIDDQAELDALLAADPDFAQLFAEQCTVDFTADSLLAVGTTVYSGGCATIEFCDVYQNDDGNTAIVYFYDCHGGDDVVTAPYHLVLTPKLSAPVAFTVYRREEAVQ